MTYDYGVTLDRILSSKMLTIPPAFFCRYLTSGWPASPIEQHNLNAELGPWTDHYAAGASMRASLDYKIPVPAQDRVKKDTLIPAVRAFKRKFPEPLLKAMDLTMELQPESRPHPVSQLQQALLLK
ncbi:hypothetical protein [Candidatus Methylobacter favarea]